MDDDLPENFDLMVVGTGLTESIVAAAASRIGKTVLHIDQSDYYGGPWASFNFTQLEKFIASNFGNLPGFMHGLQEWHEHASLNDSDKTEVVQKSKNTNELQESKIDPKKLLNDSEKSEKSEHKNDMNTESIKKNLTRKEQIVQKFRLFNIDLSPTLIFSCGNLVQLLISSNISRYAEFRAVDHVLTIFKKEIRSVPCSRADVFNSKDLTVVEKRLLMKFLSQCSKFEDSSIIEYDNLKTKTFAEYLEENKLTEKVIHSVLFAISMCDKGSSFKEGMENTLKFLKSLGRYGNTPFLFPMYGSGEIPQCFCRLCAVFGGIYCLKRNISEFQFHDESEEPLIEVKCGNQNINVKNIVMGFGGVTNKQFGSYDEINGISRGILIASKPIGDIHLNSNGGGVNFLRMMNENNNALLIQLSHYSGCCPKGFYLIHITTKSTTGNPKADIKPFIDQLVLLEQSPIILFSAYFMIPNFKFNSKNPKNIYICNGPFFEVDYNHSLDEAEKIFSAIYKDEPFLPRAPDPDEIILGDEDPTEPKNDDILGLLNEKDDRSTSEDINNAEKNV